MRSAVPFKICSPLPLRSAFPGRSNAALDVFFDVLGDFAGAKVWLPLLTTRFPLPKRSLMLRPRLGTALG
jgi:hypothetical protein